LSYDASTISAIMEMASPKARRHLIGSAFEKRDYAFLDTVFENSGVKYLNEAVSEGSAGLGLLGRSVSHPLDTAVADDDSVLLNWVVDKGLAVDGSWVRKATQDRAAELRFGALADAFALGRKHMLPALFRRINKELTCDFFFDADRASTPFVQSNDFDVNRPAGVTPLTCALVNGWDDLVGQYVARTSRAFEHDLLMAVKSGSAHVDAIASKISEIKFPEPARRHLALLEQSQRVHYFDALTEAGRPTKVSDGVQLSFADSLSSIEECAFLLQNPEVCSALLERGLDPLHNMLGAAVRAGKLDIVKWLVNECGANPNYEASAPRSRGAGVRPPIYNCDGEMLEWLVRAGADVNEVIPTRGTALMDAVRNGSEHKVERLIMLGADTKLKYEGRSALQLAKSDSMREVIRSTRVVDAIGVSLGSDVSHPGVSKQQLSPL
jgi:hypothetical protein